MHRYRIATAGAVLCAFALQSFAQAPIGGLNNLSKLREGRTMRASSNDPDWQNGNGDARPIEPGATLTIADLEGPGEIHHFWNTIASNERGYSRLLVLRMYWDGEEHPSVECPIGDFFGIGHGLDVPFDSLPIRVSSDGRGRNCYWPMPFRKSARITVTNEGKRRTDAFYFYIDWQKLPTLGDDVGYFHAMYRQEFPATMGKRYMLADITGRGHYVGTVLNCRQNMPSWFGEGDDFFFIDGEAEPSLRGTGTEDYFCDGWGFRKQAGIYYGAPLFEGYDRGNRTSVYRWHIADPVTFEKSLHVEIEHVGPIIDENDKQVAGYGERPDDFSSVAFWYQTEPHKAYDPMPQGYARLYFDYTHATEAEGLLDKAQATKGNLQTQDGTYSGGKQLFWTPAEEGQELKIPIEVKDDGNYEMLLLATSSFDYGVFQYSIDDKPLGKPVDQFNPAVTPGEHNLGRIALKAGPHTLSVKNVGKNPATKGVFCGIDGWLLTKR